METFSILVALVVTLISFIIACLAFAKMGQVEEAFIDLAEEIEELNDNLKEKASVETLKQLRATGVSDKDIEELQQKFSELYK